MLQKPVTPVTPVTPGSSLADLTLDDLLADLERRTGDGGCLHMLTADDVALAGVPLADLLAEIGRKLAALAAPAASPGQDGVDDLRLLDAPAVAALLGVPTARVYELRRRGKIGFVHEGGSFFFTRQHVADFIAARSVAPKAG